MTAGHGLSDSFAPSDSARMRVLFVAGRMRSGAWLAEAFAKENGGDIELQEVIGSAAGLTRLRDENFDALLLTHVPGELDALGFLEAMRAGGAEEPALVMGEQSEAELAGRCYEAGADAYVCVNTVTTHILGWRVARAMERHRLLRENRRLQHAEKQRLRREQHEAQATLDDLRRACGPSEAPLPRELVSHYRSLLRSCVIMGAGNLSEEVRSLAALLNSAGVSAGRALQLHLSVLEEMVAGLGNRSARHVMTRADVLVLELLMQLAEGYQRRYLNRVCPPQQMSLPGFDAAQLCRAA